MYWSTWRASRVSSGDVENWLPDESKSYGMEWNFTGILLGDPVAPIQQYFVCYCLGENFIPKSQYKFSNVSETQFYCIIMFPGSLILLSQFLFFPFWDFLCKKSFQGPFPHSYFSKSLANLLISHFNNAVKKKQ